MVFISIKNKYALDDLSTGHRTFTDSKMGALLRLIDRKGEILNLKALNGSKALEYGPGVFIALFLNQENQWKIAQITRL